MQLSGSHPRLRRSSRLFNPRNVIGLLILIALGLFVVSLRQEGKVQPLFVATPTATRNPRSYAEEAEAQFSAGKIKQAIEAYKLAERADPMNVDYKVALARFQIYGGQYEEALETAGKALLVSSSNAKAKAVYAWALDWNVHKGCRCKTYDEAQTVALEAIALDGNYAPAHAYYSEILNDLQQYEQGTIEAKQAMALDPTSVDAHRAMGYANESVGLYDGAIKHYKEALAINPNLVTIYLRLGLNYRVQAQRFPPGTPEQVIKAKYQEAIDAFSKALAIDPYNIEPYLFLSRTYFQIDQLGTAEQYLQKALDLEPTNADIHGRLGLLYFKRKNYEGAEPELILAVFGGDLKDDKGTPVFDPENKPVTVKGLPLNNDSKEYYYTLGNLWASYYKCAPNQAPAVLGQVLAMFPDDPTVTGSYNESMNICRTFIAGTTIPATATPEITPTPKKRP